MDDGRLPVSPSVVFVEVARLPAQSHGALASSRGAALWKLTENRAVNRRANKAFLPGRGAYSVIAGQGGAIHFGRFHGRRWRGLALHWR